MDPPKWRRAIARKGAAGRSMHGLVRKRGRGRAAAAGRRLSCCIRDFDRRGGLAAALRLRRNRNRLLGGNALARARQFELRGMPMLLCAALGAPFPLPNLVSPFPDTLL